MLIIMFFHFLVGFTDIYVAGFIDPGVQAAVGFIGQIYFVFIIIGSAISIATVALVSRFVGAGEFNKAIDSAKQSIIFGTLIAIGLTIFIRVFCQDIIAIAGFPSEIQEIAKTFLGIFAFALGPIYLLIISNAIFRASGEVKKPLLTMSLVSGVNIILDFALVFGFSPFPKIGYPGIALATVISATIGVANNFFLFSFGRWKTFYKGPWTISLPIFKKTIYLAWPAALCHIAWNAGTIILYNILGRLGEVSIVALASITNGLRIEAIIFLPGVALNLAASVLVGQNLGSGNPERAQRIGWQIAFIGVVLLGLMALVIFIWADFFASILAKEINILKETTRYLRIIMFSEPFLALSFILGGSLQGAGDTKGTMLVIIVGMWLTRLPLAYILSILLGYGPVGIWVAMAISMSIQGGLMAWRFHKGKWKEIRLE
jgi:putative MATE family efflux protein